MKTLSAEMKGIRLVDFAVLVLFILMFFLWADLAQQNNRNQERLSRLEKRVETDMLYLGRLQHSIDRNTSQTVALLREIAQPPIVHHLEELPQDWVELPGGAYGTPNLEGAE